MLGFIVRNAEAHPQLQAYRSHALQCMIVHHALFDLMTTSTATSASAAFLGQLARVSAAESATHGQHVLMASADVSTMIPSIVQMKLP